VNAPDDGPWFCDFNAGAPVLDEVLEEFVATERRCPANPASTHAAGRRARGVLEGARERIANAFALRADDVVFTSGGTESANLAVRGLGDESLPVLLAPVEHPAVYEPAMQRGALEWDIDATGRAIVRRPEQPFGLVCMVHAQSELGTLQPVDEALELANACDVPCFVDAAQTLGRVPLAGICEQGAVLALSPHKAGGLRGHGVLLGRDVAARLRPMTRGGSQELGVRAGTQSPALAAANALAIERAVREQSQRAERMARVREEFLVALRASGESFRVLTPLRDSLPNTVMLCFEGVDGHSLLPALDLAGVHASRGSACSSGAPTAPRVLTSMGIDDAVSRTCLRLSFSACEDATKWRRVGALVGEVVARLRKKK